MSEITPKELYSELNNSGYLCTPSFACQVYASMKVKPTAGAFLYGPAGVGKSYLPEILKDVVDAKYFFYQVSPGTREEDLIHKMLPSEDTISGIALYSGVVLDAAKSTLAGNLTILVLDEWDKSRPTADSFLLDFLRYGRISYPGVDIVADLSKLCVFITSNDEREFSEPLLTRLPKIDIDLLEPKIVRRALELSHPDTDGELINSAVKIYESCVYAKINKPATIQELRQLIDAIVNLDTLSNWNEMVYQFVTKTPENHKLLKDIEGDDLPEFSKASKFAHLSFDNYNIENNNSDVVEQSFDDVILSMSSQRKFNRNFAKYKTIANFKREGRRIYGVINNNQTCYNAVVKDLTSAPNRRAAKLGQFAEVRGRHIILRRPVPLKDCYRINKLWGCKGEICFTDDFVKAIDIHKLENIKIQKWSANEVIGRGNGKGLEFRWTRKNSVYGTIEIIVNLECRQEFCRIFKYDSYQTRYNDNCWLNSTQPFAKYYKLKRKSTQKHMKERYGKIFRRNLDAGIHCYENSYK